MSGEDLLRTRLEAEIEAAKPERRKIIPICDHCSKPWAGCHGVCAERELTLKDRLEFAIPSELTATAHVGVGAARRAAIAAELLPVVEAEIAARISVLEERVRELEFEQRRHQWEATSPPVRRVHERLFGAMIHIVPVESVREGWHEAECSCMWSTTGAENVVEDAACDHIADVHMAHFEDILVPVIGSAAAARISALEECIREALPVIEYVSMGRGYIGVKPYPDATARRVNAALRDALESVEADPYLTPRYSDVDVAVIEGAIQLLGDGGLLIAELRGDRANILRDMLGDGIRERARQREVIQRRATLDGEDRERA